MASRDGNEWLSAVSSSVADSDSRGRFFFRGVLAAVAGGPRFFRFLFFCFLFFVSAAFRYPVLERAEVPQLRLAARSTPRGSTRLAIADSGFRGAGVSSLETTSTTSLGLRGEGSPVFSANVVVPIVVFDRRSTPRREAPRSTRWWRASPVVGSADRRTARRECLSLFFRCCFVLLCCLFTSVGPND